jgi:hypothetical protein
MLCVLLAALLSITPLSLCLLPTVHAAGVAGTMVEGLCCMACFLQLGVLMMLLKASYWFV